MTPRQRYLAALQFEKPDRVPFTPGHGRESTLKAWHSQGLPPDVSDYVAYACEQLGIEREHATAEWVSPGVNFLMKPQFEEKVINHRPSRTPGVPGVLVVQDWKGNVCEISDEFNVTYLRNAIDFVTRTWLKCPVQSRADWPDMARRYDATDPPRLPDDFRKRAAKLHDRDYISMFVVNGPFWQLREWLGFEGLCMMLLDDPDFVREMIAFWQNFVSDMLTRIFEHYVPDTIIISEDMAYKEKPMIGPDMCRQFLFDCWRCWTDQAHAAGVAIMDVDSDGHTGQLIPVWIDAGFDANCPQEVAAGNDLPALRRHFGTHMAYRGGVDKRAMAKGGRAIRNEIARLKPVIDAGGYIPSCDHGIPSDVSWPNFIDHCRLLAQATGWL